MGAPDCAAFSSQHWCAFTCFVIVALAGSDVSASLCPLTLINILSHFSPYLIALMYVRFLLPLNFSIL